MSKATTTPASLEPLAIGIDIGGTGTKFGIVDRIGNVLFTGDLSTKKHKKVETFIDELHDKLSALIQTVGGPGRIRGIGVGAPNGNFYTGTVEYAQIFPGKALFRWPNSYRINSS
jgi:glucokinase